MLQFGILRPIFPAKLKSFQSHGNDETEEYCLSKGFLICLLHFYLLE